MNDLNMLLSCFREKMPAAGTESRSLQTLGLVTSNKMDEMRKSCSPYLLALSLCGRREKLGSSGRRRMALALDGDSVGHVKSTKSTLECSVSGPINRNVLLMVPSRLTASCTDS